MKLRFFMYTGTSVSADLKQKKVNLATTSEDCGLGIRTIHKGRIGSSSTNNVSQWRECLNAAIASGKLATPQEWEGLPETAPLSSAPLSFDDSILVTPAVVIDLIEKMLEGAAEHPAEVASGSASLSSSQVTLANSRDVRYINKHTGVSAFIGSDSRAVYRLRV